MMCLKIKMGHNNNTNRQDGETNQETNQETSQETNQEPYNASHEMNHNDVSETELTNTDKIRNAIANSPSVTQKELQ